MLHGLPLFATDTEIATAVVGEKRAAEWVSKALPALEKLPGFPKIDALHGGRPVPVLNLFYENYLRLPSAKGLPDGVEGEWSPRRTK
ncbi:hypothetical protein J2X43_004390 [Rhizobium sp. BE258]|nr:hypothetical protein [Rhizobium sp. BE258]